MSKPIFRVHGLGLWLGLGFGFGGLPSCLFASGVDGPSGWVLTVSEPPWSVKTRLLLPGSFGFGEGVSGWLSSMRAKNDLLRIGLPNNFVEHGPRKVLLEEVGLDSESLSKKVLSFISN